MEGEERPAEEINGAVDNAGLNTMASGEHVQQQEVTMYRRRTEKTLNGRVNHGRRQIKEKNAHRNQEEGSHELQAVSAKLKV
jgi:hypothetical protein